MIKLIQQSGYLIFLVIFFSGCIKDDVNAPLNIPFENAAEIIQYLEQNGDYINSPDVPSLIEADEVYSNINSFIILDVRSSEEYLKGHIQNAVNLHHKNLLSYIVDSVSASNTKIVVVSRNGQSASYYAALLRLAGISNVYSLNYGMASWHSDFAADWLMIINSLIIDGMVETDFPKGDFSKLPVVSFNDTSLPIEEKIIQRINLLFQEEFSESVLQKSNIGPSIDFENFYVTDAYKICYGSEGLYASKAFGFVHPAGTVSYLPPPFPADLRSTRFLQTLPADRKIILYSVDGNLSAFTTAYLRLLGYDAASLLFGANSFMHPIINSSPSFFLFAFTEVRIKNYPYQK